MLDSIDLANVVFLRLPPSNSLIHAKMATPTKPRPTPSPSPSRSRPRSSPRPSKKQSSLDRSPHALALASASASSASAAASSSATAAAASATASAPAIVKKDKGSAPAYVPLTPLEYAAALALSTARQLRFQPLLATLFPLGSPDPTKLPICLAIYKDPSYATFLNLMANCSDASWAPFLVPCASTVTADKPFLLLHMNNDLNQLMGVSLVLCPPVAGVAPADAPADAPGAGITPIDSIGGEATGADVAPSAKTRTYTRAHAWARAIFVTRAEAHPDLHPLWAALDRFLFYGMANKKRQPKIFCLSKDLQHFALNGHTHLLQRQFLLSFFPY